jgi:hypothetical protein
MGGLGALFGFALLGGIVLAAALAFWLVARIVFAILLFPVRLVLWLVALPLLLVKAIVLSVAGLVAGIMAVIGIAVAAFGLVTLLPLLVLALVGWGLVRVIVRPATA